MKKLLLVLLLGSPSVLSGQVRTVVSSYVASDGGVSGDPLVVGVGMSSEAWRLGIRGGLALDSRLTPLGGSRDAEAAGVGSVWAAEVDALLFLDEPMGEAPLVPYVVAGAGLRGLAGGADGPTAATWSYGAGFRAPVYGRLAMEGEVRHRQPLADDPRYVPEGIRAGWEFRFGASYRTSRSAARAMPLPPPTHRPTPLPAARAGSEAEARRRIAMRALDTGSGFLGVRYKWGGNTPESGFDCSGFVKYVFQKHGIELPRVSRDQARAGAPLPLDWAAFEPGDLLAFASDGKTVDHIAIYAGEGRILHSSSSGGGVRFDDLSTRRGQWYVRHLVSARRVIQTSPALLGQ